MCISFAFHMVTPPPSNLSSRTPNCIRKNWGHEKTG